MSVRICSVDPDSAAAHAGIRPGDELLALNGHEILDVLDYRFYETDPYLVLSLTRDGKEEKISVRKGQYESLGLSFETYLMDSQHSCRNRCIFCFIDQLPQGMRESLYFKDDDSRLSFLFGNYITLTNLSEHEIDRIIRMHISPINISVHTTNPELRSKMMNNRFAGSALRVLRRFAEAEIKLNCQLVLCPGWNDGEELKKTLEDLHALGASIQSIAAVPVGLTNHREGLEKLKMFDREGAAQVIDTMSAYGERFLESYGERVAYAADEFYLTAGRPIPSAEFYGEFAQLEDGVGLLSNLRQEFQSAAAGAAPTEKKRTVSIATGRAAAGFLDALLDEVRIKCHNLSCRVIPIRNDFFGETIDVAGLVTGGDILKQLRGKELGEALLIPAVMLRHEGDIFLDDVSLDHLEKELGLPVIPVKNDGYELLEAILGSDEVG